MDTNTILWIVQILVAFAFFMVGIMKVTQPREQMIEKAAWVEDFSENTIKIIGVLEVAGAIGLILPSLLPLLPVLTPLAGLGLAVIMIGAMFTNIRYKEFPVLGTNIVLLVLAIFIAYGRFVLVPIAG